jgi:hypothetical protein
VDLRNLFPLRGEIQEELRFERRKVKRERESVVQAAERLRNGS